MAKRPVFFDPTGRRAVHVTRVTAALAILTSLIVAAFVLTLFAVPQLANIDLGPRSTVKRSAVAKAAAPGLLRSAARLAAQTRLKRQATVSEEVARRTASGETRRSVPGILHLNPAKPLTMGFYASWDDRSFPSLRRALPKLDAVIPSWLTMQGTEMKLDISVDDKAVDLIRSNRPTLPIFPLLQNSVNDNWDGPDLAHLLANPAARAARLDEIVAFLSAGGFQGLCVDFEEVPTSAQANLRLFLTEMAAAFAPRGWSIILAVPFDDDDWDYAAYSRIVDFVLLMAYDEHWQTGAAGSIAAQGWYERLLDKRMKTLDPARTVVAIGAYTYDWSKGKPTQDIAFQEAVMLARDSETTIEFDPKSENPHFSYAEDDGQKHEVWMLDAVTAFNQIHAADIYKPAGYAIWRLGSEDPSLWSVLDRNYDATAPEALKVIPSGLDVDFEGEGEILRVSGKPAPGARSIEIEAATGDVVDQTYTALPTPYVMQRVGDKPGKIALTFDDGPDPIWTPRILAILKDKKAPATFFIVGQNAQANPELVLREVAEGHVVGNHTFTHPNLALTSQSVTELELNATQRLFQAFTGRSMTLMRPPYLGDADPTTADEIGPISIAQSLGYLTVGLHVDPDDWQGPPADVIIQRVLEQVADPNPDIRGRVVLLHDSGGDRKQTVRALPALIDALRAKGYELVLVSELAGLTRDQVMPPLPASALTQLTDKSMFLTLGWFGHGLHRLFVAVIFLGFARVIFLCGLSLWGYYRGRHQVAPALPIDLPFISVLIPSFNEAKVIASSVNRILGSAYGNLEVIVIDDGSVDGTSDVVRSQFADDRRVTLLTIPNGGKAAALNLGLEHAGGDVIVALDADTQFERDTIGKLVRWFADPRVGAVAGNAKVGNRISLITLWQALEYITAQNLERRALAAIGCITVVPGAVGAWRRSALAEAGGFPADTLAEDQDLTICIQRLGYQIRFDSTALAWTEAPDTARGLAKQRFRWAFGTLQCLWKHRRVTFSRRYGALGMIAMPQVWLFQMVFAVLSPLIDVLLIWQLALTWLDYVQHGDQFDPSTLVKMGIYYAAFMVFDLFAAMFAFLLERRENWNLLWWLALQRFGYRQMMYYVVLKSVIAAARGTLVGWGKLDRKATVGTSISR
jgi:cellulose synthase/poly-beta-1,6-N-acetylglucosamine synthase-like glycosyltransferase/peptidoglycan/xylan/chitin deacetylase (PgdA/CDA1 family)/spore germination protein YaaH